MAFGPDYAETLRRWRSDFHAHLAKIQRLGSTSASSAFGSSTWPTAGGLRHGRNNVVTVHLAQARLTAMLTHSASARYGLLGLPLAFVAMPLYVVLPQHHAQAWVAIGGLGGAAAHPPGRRIRGPWLGRWADRWLSLPQRALSVAAAAAGGPGAGLCAALSPR